jgi:hypothetical protein
MRTGMDRQRTKLAFLGFLLGTLIGTGINYLYMLVHNLVSHWTGREPVHGSWWSWLPLPLIFGLSLAINMTRQGRD